jgi:tRNA-dihydrouridine synthase A
VDQQDSYESLQHFISLVSSAGCKLFIIHARKAWLKGLSPKQNREIPPLHYETVHQIKKDFPHLQIIINGGIKTLAAIDEQLKYVDGVMIGREAYSNPYFLSYIQQQYYSKPTLDRFEVINALMPYIDRQLQQGVRLNQISRHILGLFLGQRGAAAWRRYLSENAHKPCADVSVIREALLVFKSGSV